MWQTSPMGPFGSWPTGSGFEYFYGFIGGETNQYYPAHLRGHHAARAADDAGRGLPLHRGHDRQGDRLGPPAEVAHARQAVLHVLRARRDPRAAPRPGGWAAKYKGRFDAGWDVVREEIVRPPAGAGCDPGRRRAHRPTGRDPDLRRHARRAQARPGPPDGGLRRLPRAHRPPRRSAHRHPRGHGRARRHARLLHHRRQRRERRGPDQRHASTSCSILNGAGRLRDRRVHGLPRRRVRRARPPTTTTPWAGPTPCARRTSGPSRSPRTGAEPATAPSSTGPTGSPPKARSRTSSTTSSTSLRRCSTPPASPSRPSSTASSSSRSRASACATLRRRRRRPKRGRPSTSRCSATAASTTKVGPRSPGTARRGTLGATMPAFDDDVWELYDTTTDWTQAHDLAAEHPDKLARAAAAVPHRGRQVRRAAPRRPPGRAVQLRPRRPTDARARATAQLLFGGMGRLTENSVLNMKNKSHAVTAEIEVPEDGGATGRDRRPGRRLRRVGAVPHRRQPEVLPQPRLGLPAPRSPRHRAGPGRHPPGPHGVRLRRRRPGQGRRRRPLRRRRTRSARVGPTPRCRWSTPPTRPATWATTPALRSATTTRPTTSRFTGKVNWVQLDIDEAAEDPRPPHQPRRSASGWPWPASSGKRVR